jgi:hypothetical protein
MIIINNKNLDRFILEEVIICYFFSISTIIRSVEDVRPIIIGNTQKLKPKERKRVKDKGSRKTTSSQKVAS